MIDVKTMDAGALDAALRDAYTKAQTIRDDAAKAAPAGTSPYDMFDGDTLAAYKAALNDADTLEAEIGRRRFIDESEARAKAAFAPKPAGVAGLYGGGSGGVLTLGDAFVKSQSYRAALDTTNGFSRMDSFVPFVVSNDRSMLAEKALITGAGATSGGPLVYPYYDTVPELAARPGADILSLVSRVAVDTDTIYWVSQSARSTAATSVSEATNSTGTTGTKPEGTTTFARKTALVETIAVTAAITERELADAAQISAIINRDLMDDAMLELDNEILSGNGTTPNLTGILNQGITTVAYSTAIGNKLDNLLRAQTIVATAAEVTPTAYVMNPVDWETMRILKSTGDGQYFGGSAFLEQSPRLWGLPVTVTPRMTAGTVMCSDFNRTCRFYDRQQTRIVVGWINDDFNRNILRIRAELRAGFVVRRPNGVVRVTGL